MYVIIALVMGAMIALALTASHSRHRAGNRPSGSGSRRSPVNAAGNRVRIFHPHFSTRDEYECGRCGRRFRNNVTVCPFCGTDFESTVTDKAEYLLEEEEELEEEEWDEEDGL